MQPFHLAAAAGVRNPGLKFQSSFLGQFAPSLGMPFVLFQETLEKTHFQESLSMLGDRGLLLELSFYLCDWYAKGHK